MIMKIASYENVKIRRKRYHANQAATSAEEHLRHDRVGSKHKDNRVGGRECTCDVTDCRLTAVVHSTLLPNPESIEFPVCYLNDGQQLRIFM